MEQEKVFWLSRHQLSPAQERAIQDLHPGAEVIHESPTFQGAQGLTDAIIEREEEGFVYAVAGPHQIADACLSGVGFGVFENHPGRRADGQFSLAAVYHVLEGRGEIKKVWENADPESDQGEALTPVE